MLSDLKSILSLLTKRERWKLALLFVLMLVAAFFEAVSVGAVPVFVAFLMDPSKLNSYPLLSTWLPELPDIASTSLVAWTSVALLGFVLFKSVFLTGVYYIQSRIVSLQQARLANRMFRAYQKAPYDWILQRSTSEFIRNIQTDTSQVIGGVLLTTLDITMAAAMSMAVISVMVMATSGSTLISMLLVGLGLFTITKLMRKQMIRIGGIQRVEAQRCLQSIQQGFGAVVDARIIGCEEFLANVHRGSVIRSARAGILRSVLTRITPAYIETVSVAGLLLVLFFILRSGETLQSSLPTLSVIAVSLVRLKQMAAKIATGANAINGSRPYIPSLLEDIRELEKLEHAQREFEKDQKDIRAFDELQLDSVTYSYPKSETPAVNSVSLHFKKGESIAFVGSTGCGKSTIVNLILGLLKPKAGKILVNGIDIHSNPKAWRTCLGYIPQFIFLINDTLRSNIAFGVEPDQIDERRLRQALESAALSEFVEQLPDGLETIIGEHGVRLSGGQRQRLGIARALYFNPQVLVMDEATSALDNRTEIEVMQAIQRLKKERTLIMIAHRLSTVKDCDRLYYLEAGRIKDVGNYNHLVGSSPAFRTMASVAD